MAKLTTRQTRLGKGRKKAYSSFKKSDMVFQDTERIVMTLVAYSTSEGKGRGSNEHVDKHPAGDEEGRVT